MMSTGSIADPSILVMSPRCFMAGNRTDVTLIGNGSISLAHTGSIPCLLPARGKPPIPSNRLPSFIVFSFVCCALEPLDIVDRSNSESSEQRVDVASQHLGLIPDYLLRQFPSVLFCPCLGDKLLYCRLKIGNGFVKFVSLFWHGVLLIGHMATYQHVWIGGSIGSSSLTVSGFV